MEVMTKQVKIENLLVGSLELIDFFPFWEHNWILFVLSIFHEF